MHSPDSSGCFAPDKVKTVSDGNSDKYPLYRTSGKEGIYYPGETFCPLYFIFRPDEGIAHRTGAHTPALTHVAPHCSPFCPLSHIP